ncbi:UDP-glucose/GDP-mannose dehydrogenase family protein [bacterium]|nr:UDP-glucose/GDP-mannose dehydrogenase family protein [bacterium]
MNICVIGTGYVGLVAGTCLSDVGNNVICVDKDQEKIKSLQNGMIPIFEPALEELIKTNTKEGRLSFSTDIEMAVKKSTVCFIAVGTPQAADGTCDLSYFYSAAEEIAKSMNEYKVIVNKSTVPPNSAEKIAEVIKKHTDIEFDIVSNPEFLKQGTAVENFLSPDRVIIGTKSDKAREIMREIYSPFMRSADRMIFMDTTSAEMTKYASNAFLATKISFINEISNICEKLGADINMVRLGMTSDSRIGKQFLYPGIGYGGSCFPKDVNSLISIAEKSNYNPAIIKAVKQTNDNQRKLFFEKISNFYNGDLKEKTFAIWGLSFKPKTNDMREAPSVTIINKLLEKGATIKAYDPKAITNAKSIFGEKISYAQNSYEALENADAMILLTEWNEFRFPDLDKMKQLMKSPVIFDARNQYKKETITNKGFKYIRQGN